MQIQKSILSGNIRPDSFIWALDSGYVIRFVSESNFSMFVLCPKTNPSPYSQAESPIRCTLINSYPTRLNTSMSDPYSAVILRCHDLPSTTKTKKQKNNVIFRMRLKFIIQFVHVIRLNYVRD
jgi:hypothetical protein